MRILIIYCLFVVASFAQIVSDYDMVTITGGTVLVDQSGNGHNGTIPGSGVTAGSTGLTFGNTALVTIPPVVGNSDFVVEFVAKSTVDTGFAWAENNSAADSSASLGIDGGSLTNSTIPRINGVGGNTPTWHLPLPDYKTDWHLYYLIRNRATGIYGVLDENLYQTQNVGNITALTTTLGAIGGRHKGGGDDLFYTGTIAWVRLRLNPTPGDLQDDYAAIRANLVSRGVYMRDLVTSKYPGGVYQRRGSIGINGANQKVLAITNGDCKIVANPCLAMVLDGTSGIMYTESLDGFHWATPTGPILTSVNQPGWMYDAGTGKYWLTASTPIGGAGTSINIYSSPVHTPNSYTLGTSGIVTASGIGWSNVNNSALAKVGSTIYFAYDGVLSGSFVVGGATSSDYVSWTQSPANPISGISGPDTFGGPFIQNIGGIWYMWGHGNQSGIPSLYRRQSSTFNAIWQRSSPSGFPLTGEPIPTLTNSAPDESAQIASASPVEWNGKTFLYYCSSDASNSLHIKLAVANMPMSQLVTTGEGASTDTP